MIPNNYGVWVDEILGFTAILYYQEGEDEDDGLVWLLVLDAHYQEVYEGFGYTVTSVVEASRELLAGQWRHIAPAPLSNIRHMTPEAT